MVLRRLFVRPLLLGTAALVPGCALFNGNPPLPKHGVIETTGTPRALDEFTEVVERADVLYVPADRVPWVLRPESGWKLIEALQKNGAFAVAWDAIASDEQALLNDLRSDGAVEQLTSQMAFEGPPNERQHCRELLRQTRALRISQLALRCPRELAAKLGRGQPLDATETAMLPTGFTAPGESERTTSDRTGAFISSQFMAEKIVRQLQAHSGEKLLVFLSRQELEEGHGVPFFVAQKTNARQLVLESKPPPQTRTRLLTRKENGTPPRFFEIEDGAPRSRGDDLGFVFPRSGAEWVIGPFFTTPEEVTRL